jgi:hypothetical protein
MKKYILIIIVTLLSFFESNGQNNLPNPLYFWQYPSSNTIISQFDVTNYPQSEFMLGWQWGGHQNMTKALKMNCDENYYWDLFSINVFIITY